MDFEVVERLPDPLTDRFRLEELPRIAPWIYEEITAIGVDEVKSAIAQAGDDPDDALPMQEWMAVVTSRHSHTWGFSARG